MKRWLRLLALGALCGAGWGVAARVWMRLVSANPEFTWGGTISIVVAATITGLGMGVVMATRRFRRAARAFRVLTFLPLGAGPGMVMLPTILVGALAVRDHRPAWRAALLVVAGLLAVLLVGSALLVDLSLSRTAIGVALVLPLAGWMSAMLAVRPSSAPEKPAPVEAAVPSALVA